MPCNSDGQESVSDAINRKMHSKLTRILCDCAREMKRAGTYGTLTKTMRDWFERHEKRDQAKKDIIPLEKEFRDLERKIRRALEDSLPVDELLKKKKILKEKCVDTYNLIRYDKEELENK